MSRFLLGLAVAACSALAAPAAGPPGWRLVWHDDFDGPVLDATKWVRETGGDGWGNGELEFYTDRVENAHIDGDYLVIEARRESLATRGYTSARLKTQGVGAWRYGRVEARIQIPRGQGLWPAFWMLGDNIPSAGWPACGEIDIMENIGKEPGRVHGTVHGPGYSGAQGVSSAYDSVPITWNLKAGESWSVTFPTGNVNHYDPNRTPARTRLGGTEDANGSARLRPRGLRRANGAGTEQNQRDGERINGDDKKPDGSGPFLLHDKVKGRESERRDDGRKLTADASTP